MSDIDALSRRVPQLCKVAPSTQKYHMEDVHRAGGVMGILAELERGGLLNGDSPHILGGSISDVISQWDIINPANESALKFTCRPGRDRTTKAFSQDCRYPTADTDRADGYSQYGKCFSLKVVLLSQAVILQKTAVL